MAAFNIGDQCAGSLLVNDNDTQLIVHFYGSNRLV